jgi:hypothetical protein
MHNPIRYQMVMGRSHSRNAHGAVVVKSRCVHQYVSRPHPLMPLSESRSGGRTTWFSFERRAGESRR